ncbi:hypothetical protein ACLB1R_16715 [Escherichia coli]
MIAEMHKDFDALNILLHTVAARHAPYIQKLLELTEQLIARLCLCGGQR